MSLSPRVVAIQGIGFSPIYVAVQGLLDYIAAGGTTRRPKSTNRLRLQRISEGHGVALSARATTRVRPVRGAGAIVLPVLVHSPGHERPVRGIVISQRGR